MKVYKTENLDVANDTLSFEVVASEEFETGQPDYLAQFDYHFEFVDPTVVVG